MTQRMGLKAEADMGTQSSHVKPDVEEVYKKKKKNNIPLLTKYYLFTY